MDKIYIVDTTLRDGEQTAGIVFSKDEKIFIAKALDRAGVSVIEAGIPAMGTCEQEVFKELLSLNLKTPIMSWNRAVISDIQASINCGVRHLHISVPASEIHIKYKLRKSREWVMDSLVKSVTYAVQKGCVVSVGAEDASRADQDFVIRLAMKAEKAGAIRFRYADTLGVLDPFTTYENIRRLKNFSGLDIEMHAHNDFGMATANTYSALKAGAVYVDTTINGIGERAGNTNMEELLKIIHFHNVNPGIDMKYILKLNKYVAEATRKCLLHINLLKTTFSREI